MSIIEGPKPDLFGKRDIDALAIFKKNRSVESVPSFSRLQSSDKSLLGRDHALSRGLKAPKPVLVQSKTEDEKQKKKLARKSTGVRFVVDDQGLDIASIRVVVDQDVPPEIP